MSICRFSGRGSGGRIEPGKEAVMPKGASARIQDHFVRPAEKIFDAGADYLVAAKGNQPTLCDGIESFFLDHLEDDFARVKVSRHQTDEQAHDREETRTYFVFPTPD